MTSSPGPWLGRIHALTILISAFLLFQVQPLVAKWILPWFGGGPAVWTTSLLFFQTVLLAGYAWAHLLQRRPRAWILHLGLIAASLAFLPLAPSKPTDGGPPALRILLLLTVAAGAPCLLLSTTGPLVQAWFARAYPDRAPYRLYALSNLGSLAALLTFPFVFEPHWGLRAISTSWSALFAAFAVLAAAATIAARRSAPPVEPDPPVPLPRRDVALWIALSAFGSAMLLASSNQLCQDVAVIPFLWVLPLSAYLVSFILAFDHPRWAAPGVVAPATILVAFTSAVFHIAQADPPVFRILGIAVPLAALFGLCLLCHGELARRKPSPHHLTGYYLAIAAGGALGGAFVSLAAPLLFSTFAEWKLGTTAAYLLGWGLLFRSHRARILANRNLGVALLVVSTVGLGMLGALFMNYRTRLEIVRSFHGVVAVESPREGGSREMVHGRILHGLQFLDEARRRKPTTYYVEASGVGRALAWYRDREDLRVGIVGLGAGTIATYATLPTQTFRFYEIDPEVERLARKHFTFLGDCRGRVEIALGDARRSLEREPPQRFHVLALDAFSGDSIPTHLLTVEAMAVYQRHLEPDGTIAVHVSNRHLDLAPVVRGLAARSGMTALEIRANPGEKEIGHPSTWVLCTRNDAAIREWRPQAVAGAREIVWTDDASDLVSILKLR